MTIESAAEFVRLRYSDEPADYRRAATEEAAPGVWDDVIRDYQVRIRVVMNKKSSNDILERLARDPSERVRVAAIERLGDLE